MKKPLTRKKSSTIDAKKLRFYIAIVLLTLQVIFIISIISKYKTISETTVNSLSIDLVNQKAEDTFQIFYDSGQGYNEDHSVKANVVKKPEMQTIDFRLPDTLIKRIRIDPGTKEGLIMIRSIALRHDADILYLWDAKSIMRDFKPLNMISSFTGKNDFIYIQSTGIDPYFESTSAFKSLYIKLRKPVKYFRILLALNVAIIIFAIIFFSKSLYNIVKRLQILLWSVLILSGGFFLGVLLWNNINLPFHNPLEVVGPLTLSKFNPNTNIVRFLTFIILPSFLLVTVLFIPYFKKVFLHSTSGSNQVSEYFSSMHRFKKLLTVLSILIFFLFAAKPVFDYFLFDYDLSHMDFFHEGEWLTPAFKYSVQHQIWEGSYFAHGAFHDVLSPYLGWKLFGQQTIGASRIFVEIFKKLIPLGAAFLFISLSCLVYPKYWHNRILISQLCIAIYLLSLNTYQVLDRRDIFVLIGLSFITLSFCYKKSLLFFIVGLFSACTYFSSIDRGAFFSALLFIIILIMPFMRITQDTKLNWKLWASLLAGVIVGWIIFVAFLGIDEFRHFVNNTFLLYTTKDLFDSYIFKKPKDFLSPFTLPMIMIGVQLFFFIMCFLKIYKRDIEKRYFGYVHLSFLLLAIFYFRLAIGRSDMPHILYSSTFAFLGITFLLWEIIANLKSRVLYIIILVVILSYNAYTVFKIFPRDFTRYSSPIGKISKFVQLDDSFFLTAEEDKAIKRMKEIFANEACVFSYTSEAAIPYLLKKPFCGKNYIVWFCSPRPKRDELIQDLRTYKPNYILYKSDFWSNHIDGIDNSQRFPDVNKYILERYQHYETIGNNWEIYKLKSSKL